MIQRILLCVALLGGLPATNAHADQTLARVHAIEGTLRIDASDARAGDPVAAGQVLATDASSRAALLAGGLFVQLDTATRARLAQGPDGHVVLELEAGRARLLDTRGSDDPVAIAVGPTTATLAGADVEVYVLSEKTGRYAMFCDWDRPIRIARDAQKLPIAPGECGIAKPGEAPYLAPGHAHQIPLLGLAPGDFLAAAGDFLPPVAAGPLLPPFGGPGAAPPFVRDPCDNPGSGCGGGVAGAAGGGVIEPAPDTNPGGFPGGPMPGIIEPAPVVDPVGIPGLRIPAPGIAGQAGATP